MKKRKESIQKKKDPTTSSTTEALKGTRFHLDCVLTSNAGTISRKTTPIGTRVKIWCFVVYEKSLKMQAMLGKLKRSKVKKFMKISTLSMRSGHSIPKFSRNDAVTW